MLRIKLNDFVVPFVKILPMHANNMLKHSLDLFGRGSQRRDQRREELLTILQNVRRGKQEGRGDERVAKHENHKREKFYIK